MKLTSKEERFLRYVKMDAVNLQGVFTNMPGGGVQTGKVKVVAGLFYALAREEAARPKRPGETRTERRRRLLAESIQRYIQRENDDFAALLALG